MAFRRRLPLEVCLGLAIGAVLAILGPYDTYDYPLLPRVGYWVGLIVTWFLLVALAEALFRLLRDDGDRPGIGRIAAIYVVTALPMTGLVRLATVRLTEGAASGDLIPLFLQTLLVGSGSSLIGRAAFPVSTEAVRSARRVDPVSDPEHLEVVASVRASESRLSERLPVHIRGAIFAIASEDHYVRVYTAAGSHILLMRMSDAIKEADDQEGRRVHRSWWIGSAAPCAFERNGRTARIRIAPIGEVPVSTPYLAAATDLAGKSATRSWSYGDGDGSSVWTDAAAKASGETLGRP